MNGVKVDLNSICGLSENIVAREIEDEFIIIPLVSGIGNAEDDIFSLNETGKALCKRLDGKKTLFDIVDEFCEEYEGERKEMESDVLDLVSEMVKRGMLIVFG